MWLNFCITVCYFVFKLTEHMQFSFKPWRSDFRPLLFNNRKYACICTAIATLYR